MCGTSTTSIACQEAQGSICLSQQDENGTYAFLNQMGGFDADVPRGPQWNVIDPDHPGEGVYINFTNGHFMNPEVFITTLVVVPCNKVSTRGIWR